MNAKLIDSRSGLDLDPGQYLIQYLSMAKTTTPRITPVLTAAAKSAVAFALIEREDDYEWTWPSLDVMARAAGQEPTAGLLSALKSLLSAPYTCGQLLVSLHESGAVEVTNV